MSRARLAVLVVALVAAGHGVAAPTSTAAQADTTPPVITLRSPTPAMVLPLGMVEDADFDCTDEAGGSGIRSCTGDLTDGQPLDTSEVGHVYLQITAVDNAGNRTTRWSYYDVQEMTMPVVIWRYPAKWASYLRGSTVLADYRCVETLEGAPPRACDVEVPVGAPLDTSTAGFRCVDAVVTPTQGIRRTSGSCYFVIEREPPRVEVRSPTDGQVVAQGAPVLADYRCADEPGGSGVSSCVGPVPNGSRIDTATPGPHTFTVTGRDRDGNVTTVRVGYTVVDVDDRTPPVVTVESPTDGQAVERGAPLLASYRCEDEPGGSSLASCDGDVDVGRRVDTSTYGEHTFTVRAADLDGNVTEEVVSYRVADETAPRVVVEVPVDGQRIKLGDAVDAVYQCEDGPTGSGVATCDGDVADGQPLDTDRLGPHQVSVRTTDERGNERTVVVRYTVVEDPGRP